MRIPETAVRLLKALTYCYGCLSMLCCGLLYSFSFWAPVVKQQFGWTQAQLDLVGACGNLGNWMTSFLSGLAVDTFGGRFVSPAAGLFAFTGFFLMSLAFPTAGGSEPPVPANSSLYCCFYFLVGMSSCTSFNSSLVPNVINLGARRRSLVVGSLLGFLGLSSAGMVFLFRFGFGGSDARGFFEFLSFFMLGVWASGLLCLWTFPPAPAPDKMPLLSLSINAQEDLFGMSSDDSPANQRFFGRGGTLQMWFRKKAFTQWSFWVIFLVLLLAQSSSMVIINHVGLFVSPDMRFWAVISQSIFNAAGRILIGALSNAAAYRAVPLQIPDDPDAFLATSPGLTAPYRFRGVRQSVLISVCCGVMVACFGAMTFLIGRSDWAVLILGSLAVCSFGANFALFPAVISLWYGEASMGVHYGVSQLGLGFGVVGLNYLVGWLYDRLGGYLVPMLITTSVAACGLGLSILLWKEERRRALSIVQMGRM
ncbi:hypothetical protein PAPYR_5547 [Paratrimastix pyriformis]|uniref:Nodulin-like domain-containing protein n=1 Tax=Paratrimastix pyriformis TaxID=342808 RepID=A0ABQ8ULJ8_9EUKA|nr:hypothetical protein PAPYR_5547 [Paratrimastix pyriformis]